MDKTPCMPAFDEALRSRSFLQVMQGMIFVWGESGPQAAAEADAMPVPGLPDMEMSEATPTLNRSGEPQKHFINQYYRELPYGWDVLAENLQDPCKTNTWTSDFILLLSHIFLYMRCNVRHMLCRRRHFSRGVPGLCPATRMINTRLLLHCPIVLVHKYERCQIRK